MHLVIIPTIFEMEVKHGLADWQEQCLGSDGPRAPYHIGRQLAESCGLCGAVAHMEVEGWSSENQKLW